MCGIAGIYSFRSKIEISTLIRFTDALSHRGPDGSGYKLLNEGKVGLGHRRLSILDLSEAGAQPMNWQDRYTITFNGEIYNFIELRKELEKEGFKFKTETDTEVILAAYQKWGRDCFHKFNGMWAIAIYDSDTQKLLVCRDRFGVKPFYYTFKTNEFFAFASETVAFKYLDNYKLHVDEHILSRSIDDPVPIEGTGYTIWNGIFQLLPGHFFEISPSTSDIRQKRWFSIPQKKNSMSYDHAKEELLALFKDAVKLRLRSDVPVATALSGGLDSSSVYGMLYHLKAQKLNSERVDYNQIKGFVATFEGTPQDETGYAKAVVEYCKGEAEFLKTDFNSIIQNIEHSTRLFNDITATPISVLGDVYKSMRAERYFVSLDGHGVDEMLYGYRSLVSMAINHAISSLQENYEKDLSETYLAMYHTGLQEEERRRLRNKSDKLRSLLAINSGFGKLKYTAKQGLKRFLPRKPEYYLPDPKINNSFLLGPFKKLNQLSDKPMDLSFYNMAERELAVDFYYRNIPYNMRDFDRAAMQHGVEIRMPFMDYRLVNFVFSLPMEYKVGNGFTKRILRDAMSGIIPERVRTRTLKIGMGAPIHEWLNNALNEYVTDTVNTQKFLQNGLWDGKGLRDFVTRKCKTRSWAPEEAQQFWNILNANIILS